MSHASRYLKSLLRSGQTATVSVLSGDVCPCTTWREDGEYSEVWHINNPTAEDCNGTGLINTESVVTNIKTRLHTAQAMTATQAKSKEMATLIGEMQKDDLLCFDAVNSTTGSAFDLTTLGEFDTFTFNSVNYVPRHSFKLYSVDELVTTVTLLKRREA